MYGHPSRLDSLDIRDRGMQNILYDVGEIRKQVVSMKWVERHGRLTMIQDYMC